MKPSSLMFIAGEASGDSHASALIHSLRARAPDLKIFGAGGPQMRTAGMELLLDLTEHAVIGVVEAVRSFRQLRRIFWQLVREAERRRPDAVVLVDYPGFNLRFAAEMKRRGFRVIYYISPQVWAWHAGRARQMERDVDLLLSIFPFEKAWFAQHAPRLRVEFVGHPFADTILRHRQSLSRDPQLILLLPGSREKEVSHNFPLMAHAIEQLPDDWRFEAAAVSDKTAAMMRHRRVSVRIGGAHDLMQQAAVAIVASGTATLECAFFQCPMVVIYHVNWLTYLLGRALVRVKWLAMPNLVAGRQIVPELLQGNARPERIAAAVREILSHSERRRLMEQDLAKVIASLGDSGASDRAAQLILTSVP